MTDVEMSDACGPGACDTQANATDAAHVTWTSEALETLSVLLRPARPEEVCPMFHIPIAEVAAEDISHVWQDHSACTTDTHNAAELACGHVFHARALAVHFCTNDMRCPVCRSGPADKAQISSFAPAMQPALLRTKNDMHAREVAQQAQETFGVDVNLEALLRDFVFEVYMQWAPEDATPTISCDKSMRLTSPIRVACVDAPASPAPPASPTSFAPDHYTTHRSFQRKFNTCLRHMRPGQNIMYLALTHPLMPDVARTPMFDKAALLAATEAGTKIALARNIGFVAPVRTDTGIVLTLYLHTSYVSLICVQQMLAFERSMHF